MQSVFVATNATLHRQPYGGRPCLARFCRPSWLVIGVGKCGTSSLYYYLTGHPSVNAAQRKQVQWFDHAYDKDRFEQYLERSFPRTMAPDTMTGEASPGYVAYSIVPRRVFLHLPETRILVVARAPADRAYSSYFYNYVTSAKSAALPFATLVAAEIAKLRGCLDDSNSQCHTTARGRKTCGLRDLSAKCYASFTAEAQLGKAARAAHGADARLVAAALPRANPHLWRQLIGRSLYALYLEWWYAETDASQIGLVCSEYLGGGAASAAEEMSRVASFLGLESFDFTQVVAKGKYNAGASHAGYEKATAWEEAEHLSNDRPPMDASTRALIEDFVRPFNERLFHLAGRRCDWERHNVSANSANRETSFSRELLSLRSRTP